MSDIETLKVLVSSIPWNGSQYFPCSAYLIKCLQFLKCTDITVKLDCFAGSCILRLSFHTSTSAYVKFFKMNAPLVIKRKDVIYAHFLQSAVFKSEMLLMFNLIIPLPIHWNRLKLIIEPNDLFTHFIPPSGLHTHYNAQKITSQVVLDQLVSRVQYLEGDLNLLKDQMQKMLD